MSNYTKNLNLFKYDPINDAKEPFDIEKCLNENWDKLDNPSAGMPVGTIITSTASSSYTPENTVYTDGTEYAEAQFTKTYSLLESGQLESCTYEEYENSITQTGECWKWGLDTETETFRVPKINDIVVRGIADTVPAKGNGMTMGLTDGSNNLGLQFPNGQQFGNYFAYTSVYGTPVGSAYVNTSGNYGKTLGVTTDPTKSGIVAVTENALKTQTIKHFVVVATGSINQSEMDWSAWASGQANKLNIDHSNDTKPYITETYKNDEDESGYIVYSNGLIEQWFYYSASAANTNRTITLLKPFSSTNYSVNLTSKISSSTVAVLGIKTKTTTDITIRQENYGSGASSINAIQVHAIGY